MKRLLWEFEYAADKLAAATRAKIEFHKGKLIWWEDKKKEVMAKIRADGIEIDESVADSYGKNYTNSNRGTTIQINEELQADLHECVGKVRDHKAKLLDYEAWLEVLMSQGDQRFPLDQDDWTFFFGR